MKKLILTLLAAAMIASMASQNVFAKGIGLTSITSPRIRTLVMNDQAVAAATNDDMVFQGDFKFGDQDQPVTLNTAIIIMLRTSSGTNAYTVGDLSGIPASPAYVGLAIYPNVTTNTGVSPLRLDIIYADGGATFHLAQGLAVAADGSSSVNYDHNWHRVVFSAIGEGISPAANNGNIIATIDGVTYLSSLNNSFTPFPHGGRISIGQSVNNGGPLLAGVVWDNIRTATTVANLATAPLISDNFDQYEIGTAGNGNNGTAYMIGTTDGTTTPNYALEGGVANYHITNSTWLLRNEFDSDYFNAGAANAGKAAIYLNSTAPGSYNITANDMTANTNDNLGVRTDIKFPTALGTAEANSSGVVASIVLRQRGLVGGDGAVNSPGEAFSIGVSPTGFFTFKFTHRTLSNTAGTTTSSTVTNIPYDHSWHRVQCRINITTTFNTPTMLFDGVSVIAGSTTAATGGTFSTVAANAGVTVGYPLVANGTGFGGFFGGGANAGLIPSVPAVQSTVVPPATGSFIAQDEFFSLAQKMTAATSAAKNIRWDNIYTTNATGTADAARLDNISSYGITTAVGTVANNTALRNTGDPWLNGTAATGGSDPTAWRIDTTDNSTLGVSGLNAVSDFFVY